MKMLRIGLIVAPVALLAMFGAPDLAVAREKFRAELEGFQETPLTLSTTGSGEFQAEVSRDGTSLEFEFTYSDIQFGSVIFAHIHLGRPALTAADVIGPAGQGISPGEFDELLRAMRRGATYANVHSTGFPGGEIRGKIERRGRGRDD